MQRTVRPRDSSRRPLDPTFRSCTWPFCRRGLWASVTGRYQVVRRRRQTGCRCSATSASATAGTNGCLKNFARHRHRRYVRVRSTLQEEHHTLRAGARSGSPRCSRSTSTGVPTNFRTVISARPPAYGLIAQDVEQVLPELVVTGDDGFKAIDYSKLPLLTIQADQGTEGGERRLRENDALKDRVAEIERTGHRDARDVTALMRISERARRHARFRSSFVLQASRTSESTRSLIIGVGSCE